MHKTTGLVLKFLKAYKSGHDGCSPTYRQIANECDLTSPSHARYQLQRLEELGLIRLPEDANDIEVVGGQWTMEDTGAPPPNPKVKGV